jgi:hypothetical protein
MDRVTLVCRRASNKDGQFFSTLLLCIITYVVCIVSLSAHRHEVKRTGECGNSKEP